MDVPLEIAFHNIEKSEAIEALIRDRAARMHRRFGHIISCHVVFETPNRNPAARRRDFHVRIETRVPGKELVVSRDPGGRDRFNPQTTVRDAFDAMERQLEQFSQEVRADVKTHAPPPQGRVLRIFSDYGFIGVTDGREIYFHRNAVVDGRFEDLEPGATVELALAENESPLGPQATTVRPIGRMRLEPAPKTQA